MIILVYFPFLGEGMDEMEFTEAESNMNDLVSEYQQYQVPMFHFSYIYHHSYLNYKYDGDSHKKIPFSKDQ